MLTMAFNDVKSGKHCVSKAAKIYGVPDETLRDKIKGRRKVDCTQKRSLYFSDEEENNILETFEMYGKNGYQYKCVDVIRIASRFVSDCRKSTGFSGGMETNNSECDYESRKGEKVLKRRRRRGKLTRKWFDGFYQRWSQRLAPYIVGANKSEKKSENLGLSANNLAEFFQRYEQILSELNLVDKPSSILLVEDIKLLYPVLGQNDEQIQKSVTIAAVTDLTGCTFPLYFIKEETESDAEKYFEEVNDVSVDTDNLSVLDHILKCFCASNETEDRILIMNGDQLFVHIGIEEWAAKHNIVLLIIPENVAIYLRPFNITAEGRFQETVNQSLISSDLSVSENYHSYKTHVEHQFSITFTEEKMIDCFKKIGLYPADVNAAKTAFLEKSMPVKKKNIRSGSRYKQYNAYSIECGCDAVIHGGLSVLRASKVYGVPENTLRGFVKERRAKMAEGSEEIDTFTLGAGQDCAEDNISEIMDKYLENEECLVSKDPNRVSN